jgi:CRP/FNR family cyclic AMP-dependent transcriptional regulator
MAELENKRIFLIASHNPREAEFFENALREHIQGTTIFTSTDGMEALFKIDNVPPNVVIIDADLPKMSGLELADRLIRRKEKIAIIIMTSKSELPQFVDDVVTGQVHIVSRPVNKDIFLQHVTRAMNWIANGDNSSYSMKFLSPKEFLIRDGEKADSIYLVKTGNLKAYKIENGQSITLGEIQAGEFVGEMAYINGEPRSANVVSVTDCELIEIPHACLDKVLFSKPAWSKALIKTLSQRLKNSNEDKIQG